MRSKLIGTQYRFCNRSQWRTWLPPLPTNRPDHRLSENLSLVTALRSGECEIGFRYMFPKPFLVLPKIYENCLNCFFPIVQVVRALPKKTVISK